MIGLEENRLNATVLTIILIVFYILKISLLSRKKFIQSCRLDEKVTPSGRLGEKVTPSCRLDE